MPGRVDLFGESWKEYAKSDSRYLTIDPLVIVVESIAAVCSPTLRIFVIIFLGT